MMGVGRWSDVQEWMERSSKLLIKKLSRHDCSWADEPSKHQCGVCIPYEIRKSGFFPELKNLNAEKPHILESPLPTIWPTSGEAKKSNLKHSSNNGPEMHFTGVPKDEFSGLTPASVLIGGVLRQPVGDIHHWFMTIDSATEAAELLETVFDLGSDFHYGLFDSADALKVWKNDADQLIEELAAALQSDSLQSFMALVHY